VNQQGQHQRKENPYRQGQDDLEQVGDGIAKERITEQQALEVFQPDKVRLMHAIPVGQGVSDAA